MTSAVDAMFFDGWGALLRTGIVGVCAYATLVVLLRISGKRTLSKMNAFDFLVTVALGSTLATVLLSKDTSLAQGVFAFMLLIAFQFGVTWLSVRWRWVRRLVTGEPQMLLFRGEFIKSALLRSRVTEDEVLAALRSHGIGDRQDAYAVVLETDASFSVVGMSGVTGTSTLSGVRKPDSL
ncbi:MAG: YetF domain-containing protein [Casimicrobiaceae bacterium]